MQTVNFEEIRNQLETIETVDDVKKYLRRILLLTIESYIDMVKVQEINRRIKEINDKYRADMEAVLFEELRENEQE